MAGKYVTTVTGMSGGQAIHSNIVGIVKAQAKRIQDRTLRQIAHLTKGKAKTKGLESVLKKINSGTSWVTISGPAGEGKTTTAYMVLGELLNNGRHVYKVSTPDEFADVVCDFNPVIMVDDIFGDIEFEYQRWNNWYSVISDVLSVEEDQEEILNNESNSKPTVIFVGRDNVIHASLRHMDRWSTFFKDSQFVVSISSDRDIQEKVIIWNAVVVRGGPTIEESRIHEICQLTCPHGFPHMCKLFVTMFKEDPHTPLEEFFRTPLKFLNQTMTKLMLDDFKVCLFKEMIKGDGLVYFRTLSKLDQGENIIRAAYDLVGSYLYEEEDSFRFDHASIYDSIASLFCIEDPAFVIEHCSLSFIHQRLRLKVSNNSFLDESSTKSAQTVFIAFDYSHALAKRFAYEIGLGHLYLVLSQAACKISQFVVTFMEYLTKSNIDLFASKDDTLGYSFLFLIPSSNSVHMLANILEQKTDLDARQTVEVLFGACWFVAVDVLNYLTKHFEIDINSRGDIKPPQGENLLHCTPIMIATQSKDEQFVQQVISLNPDVNAADVNGKTVLHYLCENGLTSSVKDVIDRIDGLDCRDIHGCSPLWYSCKNKHTDLLRLLVAKGAALDDDVPQVACKHSNLDIVNVFLDDDVVAAEKTVQYSFHSACEGGNISVIRPLWKLGVSVHNKNTDGFTPLHSACKGGHVDAVKFLCERQADINAVAENGYTPLHVAHENSNVGVISYLMEKGVLWVGDNAKPTSTPPLTASTACEVGERHDNERNDVKDHELPTLVKQPSNSGAFIRLTLPDPVEYSCPKESAAIMTGMSGGHVQRSSIAGKGNIVENVRAQRIKDRTLRQIAHLTKGKAKTKGLESVLKKINSGTSLVTISGPAGEGKTTTAYMVLGELLNNGRHVYKVSTPDEFADVVCEFNPVIMVDDIFGDIEFEYQRWNNWYSVISDVLSVEEGQEDFVDDESNSKPTVIFVGRDNVIHSSLRHMKMWSTFFTASQFVVSISSDRAVQEKVDIWNAVVMRGGPELDKDEIYRICQLKCPHGFPHVCKLFTTMFKGGVNVSVEEFFRAPLKFLNQTMKKLMLDDFKLRLFKEMIKGDGLVYVRTLRKMDKGENISRAAYDLVGSYLYEEEDSFMFDHASIYDSVACLLCDIEFEYQRWNNWYSVISDVLSVEEDQEEILNNESNSKPTVIFVGRDNVIHASLRHMDRWSTFFKDSQFVVSISSDRDIQEKVIIWNAVVVRGGPTIEESRIHEICQLTCPHGFPHMCKLFVTMFKEDPHIPLEEFFRTPLKFLNQTMTKIMLDDFKVCLFKEMIKGDGLVYFRTLSKLDQGENIIRAAYDLVGSYYYEEEDSFRFDHASIYDSIASLFCIEDPAFVIEHCSLSFIHQRLRLKVSNNSFLDESSTKSAQTVFIAFDYSHALAKRFAYEIGLGHLYLVLSQAACKISQFVVTFMEYLTKSNIDLFASKDDTLGYSFLFLIPSSNSVHMLANILEQKTDLDARQTVEVLFGACWFVAVDVLNYLTKHFEIDINSRGDIKPPQGENLLHCTPIMIATQSKDEQFVRQVISLNPDVNAADVNGKTVLHYLCENGLTSIVKDVIDRIDGLDCRDIFGASPMWYSCRNNQQDIAKLLMNRGAKLDAQMFRVACKHSDQDIVHMFLENGAAGTIMKEDHFGKSALHSACQGGDMAIIKCLSKAGFSVHDTNKDGFTPLHSACEGNHIDVVKFLCDREANVNAAAEKGYTPLHVACQESSVEVISYLLEKGADVHAYGGRYGAKQTCPIHVACFWHLPENITCLLQNGANVNSRDGEGETPLHLAVGNTADQDKEYPLFRQDSLTCETVDILMAAGAGVNIKDHAHKTPLHYIHSSNLKVLGKLIEAGADINLKSKSGSTPLLEISRKSFTLNDPSSMILLMVEQGADVKAADLSGQTCLHKVLRIFSHNFKMQRQSYMFLIEHGADLNKQDAEGNTPLHILCRVEEDTDVVTLDGNLTEAEMYKNDLKMILEELITTGADVNILNKKGTPALHGWCSALVSCDLI